MKVKITAVILCLLSCALMPDSHAATQYGLCGTAENRWSGVPLDGRFNVVYRLCDSASGGSCPWEEDAGKVDIDQGSFCVVIGETTELPEGDEGLDFLEIEVEGEALERMQLFGVPRARIADKAAGLAESVVTTDSIEDGTIEAADIAANTLGSSQLAASGVTAGTYTNATITVDGAGLLTSASSGSSSSSLSTPVSIANGGTASTTAAAARTALGAAASGANSDITSVTGLTTALSVAQGGTAATTAATARSNLSAAASGSNSDITALTGLTAGSGTGTGRTTIVLNVNTSAVGSDANAGNDDLISYTTPANTLDSDGDMLRITAWGTVSNTSGTKTISCSLAGDSFVGGTMAANAANNWVIEATIVRTGASAQDVFGRFQDDTVDHVEMNIETQVANTATANVIKCTSTTDNSASNQVLQEGLVVEAVN